MVWREENDGNGWYYFLLNINPLNDCSPVSKFSSRYVKASWDCKAYDVIEGYEGDSSTIVYRNGTHRSSFNVNKLLPEEQPMSRKPMKTKHVATDVRK